MDCIRDESRPQNIKIPVKDSSARQFQISIPHLDSATAEDSMRAARAACSYSCGSLILWESRISSWYFDLLGAAPDPHDDGYSDSDSSSSALAA